MAAPTAFRESGVSWRPRAGPALLVVLLVVVGVIPVLRYGRYYFRGDTQVAYLGWWYHLGEQVRMGEWPLMEPLGWEAGNHVAEGQWGLFSPLTTLIGLLASIVPDVVVFVTALKIVLVVLGGTGTYLVARSYGAREPFAVVAGLVVGLCAQAVFYDWPSWVNGQIAVALLPWAWWFTRRAMAGHNPAGALVLCYLTVSVGYVFCAIYLVVILLGCLVDAALSRSRRELLTILAVGTFSGLVMLAVYLPGVLTAPVTRRATGGIVWGGQFTMDLRDFFVSMLPTPRRRYLLWLLPVVLWLDLPRLRRSSRDLAGVAVMVGVLTLGVLGPGSIGPLRWPMRALPALMVPLVVLLAVVASRSLATRVSTPRLVLSLAWVCAAAVVVVVREQGTLREAATGAALVVAALASTAWSLRRRGTATTTGLVLGWTVAFLVLQLAVGSVPGAPDRHMPAEVAHYRGQIASASGDVMVLGTAPTQVVRNPAIADELLVGASWYLNPKDVQNGYTTIGFRRFHARFCRTLYGGTCVKSLAALLSEEPTTGRRWVDLLSVSTLVLFRGSFPESNLVAPPAGWSRSAVTDYTVVWTRDERLPTAGGVVATSAHTAVVEELVSQRQVRLRVSAVGPDGGTVTLSRLAWPGYSVEGAELVAPVDGMLVRVAIPAGSAGSTVTVRWDPPGWTLEIAALSTAVLTGCLWVVVAWRGSRRRRQLDPAPRG